MRSGNQLQLAQCLQTALHLASLGRFGAESIDECLNTCNFALLSFMGRLLLRQKLGASRFERRIVSGKKRDGLVLDMKHMIDGLVEKIPVVGNQQKSASVPG